MRHRRLPFASRFLIPSKNFSKKAKKHLTNAAECVIITNALCGHRRFLCGCGGIGRRVRFRFLCRQRCAGSSPVTRTKTKSSLRAAFWFGGDRRGICRESGRWATERGASPARGSAAVAAPVTTAEKTRRQAAASIPCGCAFCFGGDRLAHLPRKRRLSPR